MRLRAGSAGTGARVIRVAVVGGGLAGCEAAWQIATRSAADVDLFEMRPRMSTPAHETALLAELVCSNSLKADDPATPAGRLKAELAALGSLLIAAAYETRVPAGKALAVDRDRFAAAATGAIESHPRITVKRGEVTDIPDDYDRVVIATGPLTSPLLSRRLKEIVGADALYFYDAIAPIVEADSIDPAIAYVMDRYGEPGVGDYLNLPLAGEEYERFVETLLAAETVPFHDCEKGLFFDGCMPIEEIARRGRESLAFGPLKPVGLFPPSGKYAHAVVQLRKENAAGDALNMVGFQTKLTYPEQERVFRSCVPGMADAVFLRHGSLHRNTYLNGPQVLRADLSLKGDDRVRLAGQMTGVEGYVESMAIGLLAGLMTAFEANGQPFAPPPATTATGALLAYVTTPRDSYQPSNMNFSLFPPLEAADKKIRRKDRRAAHIARAADDFAAWLGVAQE